MFADDIWTIPEFRIHAVVAIALYYHSIVLGVFANFHNSFT